MQACLQAPTMATTTTTTMQRTQYSPTDYDDDDIPIYIYMDIAYTKSLILTKAERYSPQMLGLINTATTIMQRLAINDEHGRKLGLLAINQALLNGLHISNAVNFAFDAEHYFLGPRSTAWLARSTASVAEVTMGKAEEAAMAAEWYLEDLKRWVEVMAELRVFWSFGEGEEWSCRVCMKDDEEVDDGWSLKARMPCEHLFHKECLSRWLAISYSCPTCGYKL